MTARPAAWITWGLLIFFMINLLGVVGAPLLNSFAVQWFDTWLPTGYTTSWYTEAWREFDLFSVLLVTFQVAVAVVLISVLVGVPTAYALARRQFPGKKLLNVLFLLPILMPPMTYGIPLATVLYKFHLAGSVTGVIVANLVPAVPFVIMTMTPFIEQIDTKIESAARMCGASTFSIFTRVLAPLLVPGILAASILVLVRTVGMFELTFLTAGPDSETLVVSLFYSVSAAGIRATQTVDAMAVIYTSSMLLLLVVALRFVNPTQLVTRLKEPAS
ncbi:spermidine/putrescine ABC transporter permease [Lentzea sp. NBRC 105346]|uniref:ABC transporter permease n=1 Tax=Lentzea sp. NBRC 105346 TaxID=3032205 RepID=UPI0024A14344|nr:ABC transporter permease [Lentzea sp. NBRC 105346]GLZ34646.1 spermidine/putrescine ABC transporter permease [Lentzea sp. NBRC 105346]